MRMVPSLGCLLRGNSFHLRVSEFPVKQRSMIGEYCFKKVGRLCGDSAFYTSPGRFRSMLDQSLEWLRFGVLFGASHHLHARNKIRNMALMLIVWYTWLNLTLSSRLALGRPSRVWKWRFYGWRCFVELQRCTSSIKGSALSLLSFRI